MSWFLFLAAVFFAWLAYDAWKVTVPAATVPYAITVKGSGQSIDGVPLPEQETRKHWNLRFGIGDLSQTVWLWSILALACAVGSVVGYLA